MIRILYVCRENIRRSPAAKIITEQKLSRTGLESKVDSAGIDNPQSIGMDYAMQLALISKGYQIQTQHHAKQLTEELATNAHYIFCMTDNQKRLVKERYPSIKGIVAVLARYSEKGNEISDPTDRIGKVHLYPVFSLLPFFLREMIYRAAGKTDPRDKQGVEKVFQDTINELELCIDKVISNLTGTYKELR
ncbi:hypothetical protein HYU11_04865 [Candidatus Woesearchaeota archaeon]|nr:hypothetical protein [Candidatus Woesearchaeota archaeon]